MARLIAHRLGRNALPLSSMFVMCDNWNEIIDSVHLHVGSESKLHFGKKQILEYKAEFD